MKTKGTKVYEINGKEMRFNREAFNQAILRCNRSLKKKIGEIEEALAEELSVSTETVRNWRKGSNAPGSVDLIEEAAKFLGVSDRTTLFQATDEGEKESEMNEKQIESVKKIYDACVEALGRFMYIENVRLMLHDYDLRKKADPDFSIDDVVSEMANRMFLVVDQEYSTSEREMYDDLADLTTDIANEVFSTLHEYVEDPDRVEEKFDNLSDTAMDMMARLNGIIEKYI